MLDNIDIDGFDVEDVVFGLDTAYADELIGTDDDDNVQAELGVDYGDDFDDDNVQPELGVDYGDDFVEEEDAPVDEIAPELLDKSQTFEPEVAAPVDGFDKEIGKILDTAFKPVEEKPTPKTVICAKIFAEMYGKEGVERKHIIKAFMEKAGCTKSGAGTYHQNLVSKSKKAG
jgi:hypothetical protein